MARQLDRLRGAYEVCKSTCQADWAGTRASAALRDLVVAALHFLKDKCSQHELVSRVEGKRYVGFRRADAPKQISRPANRALFVCSGERVAANWQKLVGGALPPVKLAQMLYTACLAPCLALELFDRQNKKGPATWFECIIGHVFARSLGCNPQKAVSLAIEGTHARMTMDFLFHPQGQRRVHLPVKMSTRERVVQAWAHQRILDAAYGVGTYRGIMVVFAETKLDSRSLEVIEICVPEQWLVYQSLLSRMERIYYFDVPQRYLALTAQYPTLIQIKQIPHFFTERDQVLAPAP